MSQVSVPAQSSWHSSYQAQKSSHQERLFLHREFVQAVGEDLPFSADYPARFLTLKEVSGFHLHSLLSDLPGHSADRLPAPEVYCNLLLTCPVHSEFLIDPASLSQYFFRAMQFSIQVLFYSLKELNSLFSGSLFHLNKAYLYPAMT